MKSLSLLLVLVCCCSPIAQPAVAKGSGPDCSGGWPTNMAYARMKNAGLVSKNVIDFSKTKTERLASQKIGKGLWHQVYLVTFTKVSGGTIEAIAIHDASTEECSMTGVELFVIAQHLTKGGN